MQTKVLPMKAMVRHYGAEFEPIHPDYMLETGRQLCRQPLQTAGDCLRPSRLDGQEFPF
jgi:hypothetical protein